MTPDEILDGAAGLILTRGLAKGTLEDEKGCLCALGALRTAFGGSTQPPELRLAAKHVVLGEHSDNDFGPPPEVKPYVEACHALRDEIRYFASTGSGSIPAWNDMPHRKKEEVARTMKEAAARYRREHA